MIGLENRRGCEPTVGSNPTPSASPFKGLGYDAATVSEAQSSVVVPTLVPSFATP